MDGYYYISNNLNDLNVLKNELRAAGIESSQLHVYSPEDGAAEAAAAAHKLPEVSSFTKRNLMQSGLFGAAAGIAAATIILLITHWMGWAKTPAGWTPFALFAVIICGFLMWEAGLHGIQTPNQEFSQFKDATNQGRPIFFIDIKRNQQQLLENITANHHDLEYAGMGNATPSWLIWSQNHFKKMVKSLP